MKVICVNADGDQASLEVGKAYEQIPDEKAEKHGMIRVIDESGEDYLYPKAWFSVLK